MVAPVCFGASSGSIPTAVYVLVLPVFGILELFPVYARKPCSVIGSSPSLFGITFLNLIVWVHHMFYSGTPMWMRNLFRRPRC